MNNPRFVHLRLHSEYSITDGIVRIGEAVTRAAADAMPALALTDAGNLFGMVKFYKAARASGVKPVIGADCWVSNPTDRDKPSRILLLAASRAGYLRLCELLSRAWLTNQHRARAEIDKEWLAEGGTKGLIALSGASLGEIGQALLSDNRAVAEKLARQWAGLFPGSFYLELQRAGQPQTETLVARTVELAGRLGLPAVATHPVQFVAPEDFKAHEARVCISQGYVLGDQRRPKLFTPEQYFKTQDEMAVLFADIPQALENSIEIARRCSLTIELGNSKLPEFPIPAGDTIESFLHRQSAQGLAARLEKLFPDPAAREANASRYRERLEFEISTILQMGYPGYFLIVADFINWARAVREPDFPNGVPVGPGRGSGAGSLVAYCLGITDLDPLRYDLLFERFLNPERVSMPDFDIDFCQDGRDKVIGYVRDKYGAECVSQIATFGTMAARAVIRDCGRVLDLGYNFCDQIAKLVPFQPGKTITLEDARRMEPLLAEREENEDEVRQLLELGGKLEGLTRNVGMHAGGVLIAPGRLTDFCPLYAAEGTENVISQLDKDDVESVGLVKFDFLGLTTLTVLDWAVRYVRLLGESEFDLEKIPLEDAASYRLLAAGNTAAVFQLESSGMRDMIRKARPDRFEDIIALVALYRPGPMDLIPDFIDRKHGKRFEYLHPLLAPILEPTYGIMVYQEQVMQAAQVCAGYSLGGADLLRRAMGKKKPEEMAEQREIFVSGAKDKGLSANKANEIFDYMEKFAGYGFNKSHAAAYALVAYHTAYMKAHHAAAFMAANLSAVMDDTDKVRSIHKDSLANGLAVLPPDINASDYRFTPIDAKTVRYGLGGIRGSGRSAIEGILASRKADGRFTGLFDFCRRVDRRLVNRRAIEAMVRAGAFDAIEENRASLLASVGLAMEAADQDERQASQESLFGDPSESRGAAFRLIEAKPWDMKQRLLEEKAALGFTLSGHLFNAYARDLEGFTRTPLAKLSPVQGTVWLAGVISSLRVQMTRRGKMVVLTLDDGTAQTEITVFNELFDRHRDKLKEDALLVAVCKVQTPRDESFGGLRVSAEELLDLAALRSRYAQNLRLDINSQADAKKLKDYLAPFRTTGTNAGNGGGCPVIVDYHNGTARVDVALGPDWRVRPDDQLLNQLEEWLTPGHVKVVYAFAPSG